MQDPHSRFPPVLVTGDDHEPKGATERARGWEVLEARCYRTLVEEGRGPRVATLQEVLLLYKHLCRLGCTRSAVIRFKPGQPSRPQEF